MTAFTPAPRLAEVSAYRPPRRPAPGDLDLAVTCTLRAGEEMPAAGPDGAAATAYPDQRVLARRIAGRFGLSDAHVLVTAGADDALDRCCRAALCPGRNALLTDPTFEMLPRFVRVSGAEPRPVAWENPEFPLADVIARADADTALVAIVSPNNPTGAVAGADTIRRLHEALPAALILADLAYVEFADRDPTRELLELPRVVVARTLSKAWGLPGLRVGCALGAPEVIDLLRRAGGPYPVSGPSLAAAARALESGERAMRQAVDGIRERRERLATLLRGLGLDVPPSQASFVCVRHRRAPWLHDALAGLGIATRLLGTDGTARLRLAVPADDGALARLEAALLRAGAARVLANPSEVASCLP